MGLLLFGIFLLITLVILSLLAIGWSVLLGWIFPPLTFGEALIASAILVGSATGFIAYMLSSYKKIETDEERYTNEVTTYFSNLKSRYPRKPRKK